MSGGLYVLLLKLNIALTLRVGALGEVTLPAGDYLYVGSARRGLRARIDRHRRREKRVRWHVDYLTTHSGCDLLDVLAFSDSAATECEVLRIVAAATDATAPAPGFGASDCRSGCPAHLVRMSRRLSSSELRSVVDPSTAGG